MVIRTPNQEEIVFKYFKDLWQYLDEGYKPLTIIVYPLALLYEFDQWAKRADEDLWPKVKFFLTFLNWPITHNDQDRAWVETHAWLDLDRLAHRYLHLSDEEQNFQDKTDPKRKREYEKLQDEMLKAKRKFWDAHALAKYFGYKVYKRAKDYIAWHEYLQRTMEY